MFIRLSALHDRVRCHLACARRLDPALNHDQFPREANHPDQHFFFSQLACSDCAVPPQSSEIASVVVRRRVSTSLIDGLHVADALMHSEATNASRRACSAS